MKIEIESLRKEYGTTSALRGIDLSFPSGSLAVIVGPSGSGKSTLLNLVAGLLEPTSGTIRFDDRDVTRLAPEKRNVGFVFQSYALFPHLTVEGNVGFGVEGSRVDRQSSVRELLDRFGLSSLARRLPRELSGGERQRTALARAMAREPELLLLDEPLSALDAQMRERLRHHLAQSLRDYGRTAIHVTHDRNEAMALADLLVVMRDGAIEQSGSAIDLYCRPANEFVAQFLGEVTLVPVEVESGFVRTPWGAFRAPDTRKSGAFHLVVRPENFRLDRRNGEIRAHVRSAIYMGSHWRVEAVDQRGVALKADVSPEVQPRHGEVLELSIDLATAHFVNEHASFTGEKIHDDRSVARG